MANSDILNYEQNDENFESIFIKEQPGSRKSF